MPYQQKVYSEPERKKLLSLLITGKINHLIIDSHNAINFMITARSSKSNFKFDKYQNGAGKISLTKWE